MVYLKLLLPGGWWPSFLAWLGCMDHVTVCVYAGFCFECYNNHAIVSMTQIVINMFLMKWVCFISINEIYQTYPAYLHPYN